MVELAEDLEEISLDYELPVRVTHIGIQVDLAVRKEVTLFLRNNRDVFTWSHEDMPGISPSVMVHKHNVPSFPPI